LRGYSPESSSDFGALPWPNGSAVTPGPASPGHALVVPRRHVAGWFDATRAEQRELLEAVDVARARIEASHAPDGFNIGVNVGAAAGQTVFHLHVHVIPRYTGDVPDPTGGVRLALPHRGNYLRQRDDGG
jgi:diadenosine tetraphosphate (Ap4A) HIT family hydrolase